MSQEPNEAVNNEEFIATPNVSLAAAKPYRTRLFSRLFFTLGLLACTALLVTSTTPTTLERVLANGQLKVISRNGATTYYEDSQGLTGFEYHLALEFARELGVELVIHDEENLSTQLSSVGTPMGELAASGLTITPARQQKIHFSSPYLEVTQQLLYHSKHDKPTTVADLIGKNLAVVASSSHAERLRELQKDFPELRWRELGNVDMADLMEMVHRADIDYAIIDSNAFGVNSIVYPRARVAFDIADSQQLAWAFPQQRDDSLFLAAEKFFQRIKTDGTLADITDRFYGQSQKMTTGGALTFAQRVENRLPKYDTELKNAAKKHDLDWRLLAAISYQESHWDPAARSHTGVRGMMMLTRATAREMGVEDRLDVIQSIDGGARYFKKIFKRLPERIQGQDRINLTLVAYNVGYGHMEDARVLTQRLGGDPDQWEDVRQHLPKLAKGKYYRTLKHGYARGWEPVDYVDKITNFHSIIAWHQQLQERRIATLAKDSQDAAFNDTTASMSLL
jgi:membrane-bound lytic murein transglycosylase F